MGAVRRVNPGAAGAGAIDVALHIDLHPVRHADLLVRRHVGEDAAANHVAGAVELDAVDVGGLPRIGNIQHALAQSVGCATISASKSPSPSSPAAPRRSVRMRGQFGTSVSLLRFATSTTINFAPLPPGSTIRACTAAGPKAVNSG